MFNKILFILLIVIIGVLSVLSVREYQDYRDQKAFEQQIEINKAEAAEAARVMEMNSLQSEVNRLQAECEKGVVAFLLLTETEQQENEAPLCNLETQIQVVQ